MKFFANSVFFMVVITIALYVGATHLSPLVPWCNSVGEPILLSVAPRGDADAEHWLASVGELSCDQANPYKVLGLGSGYRCSVRIGEWSTAKLYVYGDGDSMKQAIEACAARLEGLLPAAPSEAL